MASRRGALGSAVPGVCARGEFGARTSYALGVNGETLVVDSLVCVRTADSERRRRWWHERYLPALECLVAVEPEHVLVTPAPGNVLPPVIRAE